MPLQVGETLVVGPVNAYVKSIGRFIFSQCLSKSSPFITIQVACLQSVHPVKLVAPRVTFRVSHPEAKPLRGNRAGSRRGCRGRSRRPSGRGEWGNVNI